MQDELIERLGGVDAVAEMSGRKRRMVKQPNGSYKYCSRSSGEIALEKVCLVGVLQGFSRLIHLPFG